MARDLNKVILTGRLGKDVELRVTPSGSSVATFSVASSRNVKEGDGWKEQTEWFRVVAWEKLAETCANYLHKGSKVLIEGRLQTREWTDKENVKRSTTEVIATEMLMLDSKKSDSNGDDDWGSTAPAAPARAAANGRGRNASYEEDVEPEEIPF